MMLIEFLLGLAEDPAKHAEYKQDPLTVIARASLTEEERSALKNGDLPKLMTLVTKVNPKGARTIEIRSRPIIYPSAKERKPPPPTYDKKK